MNSFNIYDYVDHVMCINYINNGRFDDLKNEMSYLNIDVNNVDKFTFVYSYDKDFPFYNFIANYYENLYVKTAAENLPFFNTFNKHAFDVIMTHYKAFKIAQAKGWERVLILEDDIKMLNDLNKIQDIFNDIDMNNDLIILDPSAEISTIFNPNFYEVMEKYPFIKSHTKYFYNAVPHAKMDFFSAAFNIYNQKAINTYLYLWENVFMFSCDEYFCLSCSKTDLNIGIVRYPVCQTIDEMKVNLIRRFFINDLTNDNFRK